MFFIFCIFFRAILQWKNCLLIPIIMILFNFLILIFWFFQVCNANKVQFTVHFHGQIYNSLTLENIAEGQSHPVCDFNFPLCGSCVQIVTLYSRLVHHKYHFFQLGCKKVSFLQKPCVITTITFFF